MGGGELAEASVYHFWLGVAYNYFVAGNWVNSDESNQAWADRYTYLTLLNLLAYILSTYPEKKERLAGYREGRPHQDSKLGGGGKEE